MAQAPRSAKAHPRPAYKMSLTQIKRRWPGHGPLRFSL